MTPAIKELNGAGVAFTVREYERGEALHDFGREAADKLGLDPDQVFKTLLVTADGGQAVAIVPVSSKLSLKALGKALCVKRVDMCDPAIAERVTGYVRGGISPFGQKQRLPTVLDETATVFDTIYVSGGKRGFDIGVAPNVVIDLLEAVVADIAGERGLPRAQVALAWVLQHADVTAPIIGVTREHHLSDALAALEVNLSEDEVSRLEEPYIPHAVVGFQ